MRVLTALLTALFLSSPAAALQLIVWDRDLSTKLGDGESTGGRVTVRLATDYNGPVVVLFAPTDDERARGTYAGLKSRYVGTLTNGQLNLFPEDRASAQSITKFLSGFKLSVNVQVNTAPVSLPGLRKSGAPGQNR